MSFMGFVTEPWHSRNVLFLCECAASSVRALFHFGVWCSDAGTHVLRFGFVVGVRTLALRIQSYCVRVRSRVRSAACSSVHVCWVLCCCTQFVFYRLCAFMLSCLVWTRGLWVFSLAACSCPVLHMAGDLFAGHVLVFLFCTFTWPHPSCLLIIG